MQGIGFRASDFEWFAEVAEERGVHLRLEVWARITDP